MFDKRALAAIFDQPNDIRVLESVNYFNFVLYSVNVVLVL